MIQAVIKATDAVTNTAAADKSLINFIFEFCCGQTISQSCSIAVLKSSAIQTRPIETMMNKNFVNGNCTTIDNAIIATVATACIMALCVVLKK